MALTASALNTAADSVTARADQVSLHDADPAGTGANELSGGSPAYARKTPTWGAASGGVAAITGALVFDVPTGATVAYVGYWDSTGPTFLGSDAVTNEVFAAQGQYSLDTASLDFS